jgi:hypothetical protein
MGEQNNGRQTRTVGSYQVFHGSDAAVGDRLSGTTAEARGPGSNSAAAKRKRCIAQGRYGLMTTDGPTYMTWNYRSDETIRAVMPGLELVGTGVRGDILVHPGKNAFLSSVGCINLCTRLPDAAERIDYPGSRGRVIALIEDLKGFLGDRFPDRNGRAIPNAFVVIE